MGSTSVPVATTSSHVETCRHEPLNGWSVPVSTPGSDGRGRLLAALLVAVVAAVSIEVPSSSIVAAETFEDGKYTVELSSTTSGPGGRVDMAGTGCLLNGVPLERATALLSRRALSPDTTPFDSSVAFPVGPDGTWSGRFLVPAEAPPGQYQIAFDCGAADFLLHMMDVDFTVTASPPPPMLRADGDMVPFGTVTVEISGCTRNGLPLHNAEILLAQPQAYPQLPNLDQLAPPVAAVRVELTEGTGSAVVAVPADIEPGHYVLVGECLDEAGVVLVTNLIRVTVSGPTTTTSGPPPPGDTPPVVRPRFTG